MNSNNDSKNFLKTTQLSQRLYARLEEHAIQPHFHDTYSIGVVVSGTCEFVVSDQECSVSGGQLVVFNPFQVHTGKNKSGVLEYHMFYPSMELVETLLKKPGGVLPVFSNPVIRDDGLFAQVRNLIGQFDSTNFDEQDILCRDITESVLNSVPHKYAQINAPNKLVGLVGTACRYIEENLDNPLSVEELAKALGVSRSHLSRKFKRAIGLSPAQYVRHQRLRQAQKLIVQGERQIDVATAFHFFDQAHFSREFKRITGMSPSKIY